MGFFDSDLNKLNDSECGKHWDPPHLQVNKSEPIFTLETELALHHVLYLPFVCGINLVREYI